MGLEQKTWITGYGDCRTFKMVVIIMVNDLHLILIWFFLRDIPNARLFSNNPPELFRQHTDGWWHFHLNNWRNVSLYLLWEYNIP